MSQREMQRINESRYARTQWRGSQAEAAELLQLSEGQVKQWHDPDSGEWVHHGNGRRSPANAVRESVRRTVEELARGKYAGFNDSHLQEKLLASEGIAISRSSVQRLLRKAQVRSP